MDVIGSLFAGKGLTEHLVGVADDDPLAKLGLRADAIGISQMVTEQILTRKAPQQLAAVATPIINAGLMTINGMQLLCGLTFEFDKGEKFTNGATAMNQVAGTLDSATPTEDWESSGSQAYADQNSAQQQRANDMASTDTAVQGIIAQQAGQVKTTKDILDASATVLTAMIPVVMLTRLIPPPPIVGIPMAEAMEIGAVAGALPPCAAAMGVMAAQAAQNAAKIQEAVGQYQRVAADAKPTGTTGDFTPPPGSEAPSITDDDAPPATQPPAGTPAGGGGGAPSGGGGGAPSGGGGGAPTTPSTPPMPQMPKTPSMPSMPSGGMAGGSPGGGISGGGAPSAGSSGASGGGLGGLFAAVAQIATAAVQAGQQAEEKQAAEKAAEKDAAKAQDDNQDTERGEAVDGEQADDTQRVSAGADTQGGRAPVEAATTQGTPSAPQTAPMDRTV
jgi:hypothetical protein